MSKEIDYLFEMYKKYAPTETVGTYECETDEGNKWLDNIIIAKKKIEALEIIKKNPLMICADYYKCIFELKLTYQEYLEYFPNEEDRAIKTQEDYELLKSELLCYE